MAVQAGSIPAACSVEGKSMSVFEFLMTTLSLAIVVQLCILAAAFFLTEGDDE